MDNEVWTQVPVDWPVATPALVEHARAATLTALGQGGSRPAAQRLADYYDPLGNYAGATFAELEPRLPIEITATDLHATTLLSVEIGPGASRRLLHSTASRGEVLAALADVPEKDLLVAGPDDLVRMETLYVAVKAALSSPTTANPNAWVTASKLCARKRPGLFPVRDNVVCRYLGLIPDRGRGDYRIDWQVYRSLIGDREIISAIDALVDDLRAGSADRELRLDSARLRVLDAALWTFAVRGSDEPDGTS